MITLSYSTINELTHCPHTWLCKQMGLEREQTWQMRAGDDIHRIIQDHVSGVKKNDRLSNIKEFFPIVEEKKFDKKTYFKMNWNDQFALHGYVDGINPEEKKLLEIKTSSKPWGLKKFYDLMQWRIYGLGFPESTQVVLITTDREMHEVYTYSVEINEYEKEKAREWVGAAIQMIETGDFDLELGKRSMWCNYKNCPFCNS